MPNTREKEKLIELLDSMLIDEDCLSNQEIAEILIANGVTIQRECHWATETAYKNGYEKGKQDALMWIPVSERLPEDGNVVLGYMASRDYRTLKWKNNTQRWEGLLLDYAKEFVTHWMPLPEAPGEG